LIKFVASFGRVLKIAGALFLRWTSIKQCTF
jgi:threonine/homoserine/homoserine lactone efflux protein